MRDQGRTAWVIFACVAAGLPGCPPASNPPPPVDAAVDLAAARPDLVPAGPRDMATPASCRDGKKNNDETDLDCGGACDPCALGKTCLRGPDCQTNYCVNGRCETPAPSCSDGEKNGQESDLDCGGPVCPKCADGRGCNFDTDCLNLNCQSGACAPAPVSCNDRIRNGAETDVDCGGRGCPACDLGKRCLANTDCMSGRCDGGLCVPRGGGPIAFAAAAYPAGAGPFDIAAGDLNGDVRPDLVTANETSGNVSQLLGRGDGTFMPMTARTAGTKPDGVGMGDLNGDGIADIAVANASSNDVTVLITGGATQTVAVGKAPSTIAVSDLNGDGKLDLAVPNYGSDNLSVLVNNGKGAFALAGTFTTCARPVRADAADYNKDGKKDLVVACETGNAVHLLLGRGGGLFNAGAAVTGTFPSAYGVAAADLDGDGNMDLAVVSLDAGLSVLIGTGNGGFAAQRDYQAGTTPASVAAADFNFDGKLDLAVVNADTNDLAVFAGAGDGTFTAGARFPVGIAPFALVVADFDRDGKPDVATANHDGNSITVLLNTTR